MDSAVASAQLARRTLAAFAVVILAWSLVWLAKDYCDRRLDWFRDARGTAIFWLVAKVVVWILPALLMLRIAGRDFATAVNFRDWRRWTRWGIGIGLAIAVTGVVPKLVAGTPVLSHEFGYATLTVLVVAPLFEELLIRGALMGNLIPALGVARANLVAAFCFVVLHLPGWYMMGSLSDKITKPIGGAGSIFVLGLCFGYAMIRGRSFLASVLAHGLNNLAA